MTRLSGDWPLGRRLGQGDWACGNSVSGNCLCAGSGLLAGNTVTRDARPYRRTLRNAGAVGGWLKRRRDGGFPSCCAAWMAALNAAVAGRPPYRAARRDASPHREMAVTRDA